VTVGFGGSVELPAGFTRTVFVNGLGRPTMMTFAPDGRLFVSEKDGPLRVVRNGVLLPTPFHTFQLQTDGERGLLGVAFDPAFATTRWVYVYYTATNPTRNIIVRMRASATNADVADASQIDTIFQVPNLGATNHNGGALHFGPDGKLYLAVGDHFDGNSQSLTTLHGKILRLNADGSIPTDNPFYTQTTGNNRAIWARGLRNPFTFGFQPGTGRMLINDVGEGAWEEINEGIAGANYGWPSTEGPTTNPAFRSPIYAYPHSGAITTGSAIVGAAFYDPPTATFPASYVGDYFFADYVGSWVARLDPANGNAVYAFARFGGPYVFGVLTGPDGALYVLAERVGGSYGVWRIQRTP
jgi:glucose/arabinose dehydrogenase